MQMKELQEKWLEGKIDKKLYWTIMRENYTSVLPQIQNVLKNSKECDEIQITKEGCILKKSNGLKLYFDFKQSICRAETDLLMKEDYEKGEMDYISNYLKENPCLNVLDVGANVGLFSLELNLINPDICKINMPVDLYKAYGEYRYGIFTNGNPYPEGLYDETGLISKDYA